MEGLNEKCFICRKLISQDNADNGNRPMRKLGIPGFVHLKCFINLDSQMISDLSSITDLSSEVKKLIGE